MENRVYTILLLGSSLAAFVVHHRGDEAPQTESPKPMFDIPAATLRTASLVTKSATTSFGWEAIESGRKPVVVQGDFVNQQTLSSTATRRFYGNAKLRQRLKDLSRLEPKRWLGQFESDKLEKVGLNPPQAVLSIEGDTKLRVGLGIATRGGAAGRLRYARLLPDGEVALVDERVRSDFDSARARFFLRKLRLEALSEVAEVTIRSGKRSKSFVHQNRKSPRDAYWASGSNSAPGSNSEVVAEIATNFIPKIDRIIIADFVRDPSRFERATSVFSVDWTLDNGTVRSVEFRREGADKTAVYMARSTETHAPVLMSKVETEQLEKDLPGLFAE